METGINLADLFSKEPKVKFACAKRLLQISKDNPRSIYSDFDFFVGLLESDNNIIKWTAIDIIGNLAKVDHENKVDKQVKKLTEFLNSGKLITANHAIGALSQIALTKPEYLENFVKEVLKVEKYTYDTDECRNIAIGKVILALENHISEIKNRKDVIKFLQRQTKNTRHATAKKAEKLLAKIRE